MDSRAKELISCGEKLFSDRQPVMNLWQEIADNFYCERADFTASRSLGTDFASQLTTSYPLMVRRDLGNAISGMLRPTSKDWFAMRASRPEREDNAAKRYLEWATKLQKRAMYDRAAQFVRATKEGDHDFASFGQCAVSVELNRKANTLLYRCWHLRDVAWCEGFDGSIDTVYRKWRPSARQLRQLFGNAVHETLRTESAKQDPHREVNVMHVVVPAEEYQGAKKFRTKYVSIYVDVDNQHIMEEVGARVNPYVIPRWQTVSGSQYAFSPATVCALPDSRLIQAMALTLLEAGEKATNPPMLAIQEAIRSDVSVYAGGITWVDASYDGKLSEVLRPLTIDKSGLPMGMDMQRDLRSMVAEAFYINKLTLPAFAGDMTAYETAQRVQEYIRQALPIFEPMETEYNGALCERTFEVLMDAGAFGSTDLIPRSLRGADFEFKFESPLQEANERQLGQTLLEAKSMLAAVAELDPGVTFNVDASQALREVLDGIGVPASWIRPPELVAQLIAQQKQAQDAQQLLADMGQGAGVIKDLGQGARAVAEAQV